MLLSHLGKQVRYRRLLCLLDVQPWGTPHRMIAHLPDVVSNIMVEYKQGDLHDLFSAIDEGFPIAVFVNTHDLPYWKISVYHAVVLVGYDEHLVYLNDPAFNHAPQEVSHGDFELAWIAHDSFYAVVRNSL